MPSPRAHRQGVYLLAAQPHRQPKGARDRLAKTLPDPGMGGTRENEIIKHPVPEAEGQPDGPGRRRDLLLPDIHPSGDLEPAIGPAVGVEEDVAGVAHTSCRQDAQTELLSRGADSPVQAQHREPLDRRVRDERAGEVNGVEGANRLSGKRTAGAVHDLGINT